MKERRERGELPHQEELDMRFEIICSSKSSYRVINILEIPIIEVMKTMGTCQNIGLNKIRDLGFKLVE